MTNNCPPLPTVDELLDTTRYRPIDINNLELKNYVEYSPHDNSIRCKKVTKVDEPYPGMYESYDIAGPPNVRGGYVKMYYNQYYFPMYEKIPDIERIPDLLSSSRREIPTDENMLRKQIFGHDAYVKNIVSYLKGGRKRSKKSKKPKRRYKKKATRKSHYA